MNYILILIKFLPQLIEIVKKIKLMVDDGLTEAEIKNALQKIELAFENIQSDDALGTELSNQFVRPNETETKAES